jgi:short-subunit dehydrogenase
MRLKKLSEQIIVITGASSGIGLVTARLAAKQGARLVLAARAEEALKQLADEINGAGGQAIYVVADVANEEEVENIANRAVEKYGGFDTWVNNAGVSIYGRLLEVSVDDMRQLFETNFWGLTYGSLIAARHLKDRGGAIINVGSTLSDTSIPLQGMYSASKHAVKGFTDALRMELESERAPVSVTLIKPAAIDTPYARHARNYMDVEPKNPPPVYAPDLVADAILHCAVHPHRDVFVGGGGKFMSAQGYHTPRLADRYKERFVTSQQRTNEPPLSRDHRGLYEASGELEERGNYEGHVAESSLYTKASLHPLLTAVIAAGAGVALAALLRGGQHHNRINTIRNVVRKTVARTGRLAAERVKELARR